MFDSFKKKWHGIPVWVYAVGVALLVFAVYLYLRHKNSGTANATPLDAGTAADNETSGVGGDPGSGSSGFFPPPNTTPETVVGTPDPGVLPSTDTTIPPLVPAIITPATPLAPKPAATKAPSSSVLVPSTATATSLQSTVAPVGPSGVLVPGTAKVAQEVSHPAAVKVTANKTGGSANKAQGVFSIH